MKQHYLIITILFLFSFIISCSDKNELFKSQSPILGEWVYDNVEYKFKINNQDINNYVDSLGVDPEKINQINTILDSELVNRLKGKKISFRPDNSYYTINKDERIEVSGTYEFDNELNKIILTPENSDNFHYDILNLSEDFFIKNNNH